MSAYCEKSSYLTLCLDCDACIQCFACVGLSGEEEPDEEEEPELERPDEEEEPEPEPLPPPPEYRVTSPRERLPDAENTVTRDPTTQTGERGTPRRVDPYTDRTSRLPGIPVPIESGTGSWPPIDAQSARSMDREPGGNEPWEELFEPDELPPPRPRAKRPEPAPSSEPEPPPPPSRGTPRPGRFDRLVTHDTPREAEPAKPAEPLSSFMGRVTSPPSAPSDPESTGSIRRAKRPRRD